MVDARGMGFALEYRWCGGPTMVIRVFELFTPSMRETIKVYNGIFGQAVVHEPAQQTRRAAA